MTPERWQQIVEITERVLASPSDARERAIADLCRSDDELIAAVRAQLAAESACPPAFLPVDTKPAGRSDAVSRPRGERIGRFEVLRRIGQGGVGVVYEAIQVDLNRHVALKVVDGAGRDRAAERLHREAAAASGLRHPGIVVVLDHGHEGDRHWIAMELVPGHNLAHEIRLQQGAQGSSGEQPYLPGRRDRQRLPAVVEMCARVVDALQHAHEHGVVHRDVKPSNIQLQPDGLPKLVDFGLARLDGADPITLSSEIAGTPAYMSPEQARGDHAAIDHRTDIHSIGAVLFELLSGRPPYGGGTMPEVLDRIRSGPVPRLRKWEPSVPLDLDAICARAMAESPADRYATAAELGADLRRFLNFEAVLAARHGAWQTTRRWLRRHRRRLLVGLAMAATVVVGSALVWRSARENMLADDVMHLDQRVEAALARGDLTDLRQVHATLAVLRPRLVAADSGSLRRVDAQLSLLRAHGEGLIAAAERRAHAALGDAGVGDAVDEMSLLAAIADIGTAAPLVAPKPVDDAEVWRWFPLLSLDSEPGGAEVYLHPVTIPDGDYMPTSRSVGRTPLVDVPVAPGQYRVVVKLGNDFAELTRWLGVWTEKYDLGRVTLRATGDVTRGMVAIAAGTQELLLAAYIGTPPRFARRRFAHRAFFIDRCEVSNGDYAEFLAAHADAADLRPMFWRERDDDSWHRRPVVRVSYGQMRAYAEWRGKRLPTETEWAAAAFGNEARRHPWGDGAAAADVVIGKYAEAVSGAGDEAAQTDLYLRHTVAVDRSTSDASPAGVLHLAGNVSEMTDSVGVLAIDDRFVPMPAMRRLKGCAFDSPNLAMLRSHAPEQISAPFETPTVGFRCAKSAGFEEK